MPSRRRRRRWRHLDALGASLDDLERAMRERAKLNELSGWASRTAKGLVAYPCVKLSTASLRPRP